MFAMLRLAETSAYHRGRKPERPTGLVVQIDSKQRALGVGHSRRVGEEPLRQLVIVNRGGIRIDEGVNGYAGVADVADVGGSAYADGGLEIGPGGVIVEVGS
ncbi:hypothetical protein ABT369_16965 [Dactylosporangium sp. NPDC000244]|uniref:hypothetical protein n=1 Tax=Dactylosporangium sp. NPDC000244 TaxID=3154365 RepID=UPI00332EDA59